MDVHDGLGFPGIHYKNDMLLFEGVYLEGKIWNGKGYNKKDNIEYEIKNGKGYFKEY